MQVELHKVLTLPQTPAPNAFYFVLNGTYAEAFLTDEVGNLRQVGNSDMIVAVSVSGGGAIDGGTFN